MGTILQETGHDAVIVAFINSILKEKYKHAFYVITAAMGPKRDIYFFEPSQKRYLSAWYLSRENYIPEFCYRITIPKNEMKKIVKASGYQKEKWYKLLSKNIGKDLKNFLSPLCLKLEKFLKGDLPDIIGFNKKGNLILMAEIKFEGFSQKAKESVLKEYELAKKLKIPYFLIIPKNPVYTREITSTWLKNNLPQDMKIYKFDITQTAILPKQNEIKFIEV